MTVFTQTEAESIADALGDTVAGLTGSEIGHLLRVVGMADPDPALTKRRRLFNAFAADQNRRGDRRAILAFIRKAMAPGRWTREPERYELIRANLNRALAFAGLAVDETGSLQSVDAADTLAQAERRARDLRADMVRRDVHPDVLGFCKAELLAEDHFHAVLEAVKSVADKLRVRTGLLEDGADLVTRALGGDQPMLAINPRHTKSEKDEQRGFVNLLVGIFGMFRNPTAHEARVKWKMDRADAEDLLSLVSLIHRRIDAATMPPRT
jgi:uncharacterized protein (TIGR02391 family)